MRDRKEGAAGAMVTHGRNEKGPHGGSVVTVSRLQGNSQVVDPEVESPAQAKIEIVPLEPVCVLSRVVSKGGLVVVDGVVREVVEVGVVDATGTNVIEGEVLASEEDAIGEVVPEADELLNDGLEDDALEGEVLVKAAEVLVEGTELSVEFIEVAIIGV